MKNDPSLKQIRFSSMLVLFLTSSCIVGLNFTTHQTYYLKQIHFNSGSPSDSAFGEWSAVVELGWPFKCYRKEAFVTRVKPSEFSNYFPEKLGWLSLNLFATDAVIGLALCIATAAAFQSSLDAYDARKNKCVVEHVREASD